MSLLNSIKSRFLLAVLIPLMLLIALVVLQSYRDWQEARQLRDLEPFMELSRAATAMLHTVRRERGDALLRDLPGIDAVPGPDRTALRRNTDRAFERFRTLIQTDLMRSLMAPSLQRNMTVLDATVIELPRLRALIDSGDAGWGESFAFYNRVNGALTSVSALLAQYVENGPALRHLLPAVMLQNAGEEASKAADAGALVLSLAADGQAFGRPFVRFFEANTEDSAYTEGFFRLAAAEQNAGFAQSAEDLETAAFSEMRQKLAQLPGSKDLTGLSTESWYAEAGTRLQRMNRHVDRLIGQAEESVRTQIDAAETAFLSWLVVSAAFLSIAGAVTVGLAFPVSNQILAIRHALLAVADGAFDKAVPFRDRHDEIGDTARALEQLRENAAEQALVQETLKATHRSMSEGILVLAADGIVSDANEGAGALFGKSPDQLIGRHVSALLPDDPLADLGGMPFFDAARDPLARDRDARAVNDSGATIPVRLSVAPMGLRGRSFYTVVVSDNSERARVAADLKRAAEIARSADIAKGNFLANMSHEIRTPLHGIIGMARLLGESGLDSGQKDHLSKILASTELLLGIINDILDFSKIDAGELILEETDFSLRDVLSSTVMLFELQAKQKGVDLQSAVAPEAPDAMRGDPLRLSQIIMNLVSNAVKFTERGSVDVGISCSERGGETYAVAITVKDTGLGLAENQLETLFEPFTQADATTTRRFGGSGLGLAITRGLAHRMGGDIAVTSRQGKGATFRVEVLLKPALGDVVRSAAAVQVGGPQTAKPMRILVAEDNEINQMVVRGTLEKLGMSVDLVANGAEALEALEDTGSAGYDLVFMDIQMPVMDGYEAVAALRREARFDSLPVISMTAHAFREERDKCLAAGMQDHVTKPFRIDDLRAILERWSLENRPDDLDIPQSARPEPGTQTA